MSQTSDELVQEQFASIPPTEALVGVFVSQSGNIATVDQGGRRLQVKSTTQVPCRVGDPVRLDWRHGELVMLGPSVARAVLGRITAAGNPATVEYPNGSGITDSLPVLNGVALSVNDIVFLDWASGGLVVGKVASPVAPPAPIGGGGVPGQVLTLTFFPIDSGSYQSGYGWRTTEVWSSASNQGAWFYGDQIQATIPDTAVIQAASIYLPSPTRLLGAAPFGRHGYATKPGGAPSFAGLTTLPALSGQVAIPTTLIDHLKANTGGLGFDFGGYNVWPADGGSGALTVTYAT